MATFKDKSLAGKFLVSMPNLEDESFHQSVVYLCSHGQDGAMGFIINKKLKDFSFSDLSVPLDVNRFSNLENMYLYQGGPVERIRGFVLHSAEYNRPGTYQVDGSVAVSSNLDVLKDIAYGAGPAENLVALGYSAWEPMQLEREILNNDWLIVEASNEILFHTEDSLKWEKALARSGVDLSRLILQTGHA
ncbi:MAG: YqgE/AlgH family protein [Alphaproteobacteria bacterium]|nr:YqgE/AlgH family protein [Alphaproteobacteria bacterium]